MKNLRLFFLVKKKENYVRRFPRGTIIFTECVKLDCKGHTYRQIMGLDELDCEVKHEFLEHPKRYFIKSLWYKLLDFLRL